MGVAPHPAGIRQAHTPFRAPTRPSPLRWLYFQTAFSTNRVFFAFVLDAGLYSVWQATLLKGVGATPLQRFVPFLGLAAHLLQQPAAAAGGAGAQEDASS